MVFGVFDGLHPGHLYFLKQAREYGDLIAVVARDQAVAELKKGVPFQSEKQRIKALKGQVAKAVLGDRVQGSYGVLKRYRPDVVCLGYDQLGLKRDLEKKMKAKEIPKVILVKLAPHRPKKFHTSLLH